MKLKNQLIAVFMLFIFSQIHAQKDSIIRFANPSFERIDFIGAKADEWFDCGFKGESAADIQPYKFAVSKTAKKGDAYLGMVVRDNNTFEAVGQKLSKPLEKGKTYQFKVHLAISPLYVSQSRLTSRDANYDKPVIFVVEGNQFHCGDDGTNELFYKSPTIDHENWREYTITFTPKEGDYQYISLIANYVEGTLKPYNGNILVDNLSEISLLKAENSEK